MTYKEIIRDILDKNPGIDDKNLNYLVYKEICRREGDTIFIPFNLFKKLPAFETISRTRRKLTEKREIQEVKKGEILTKPMSYGSYPYTM